MPSAVFSIKTLLIAALSAGETAAANGLRSWTMMMSGL
jgi:hypothetical protein